jgi:hypothetical protein
LLNSIEFEKGDKGGGLRRLWEAQGYKGKAGQLMANPNDVALPHVVFEMDTGIENREWDRHVFGDLREQEMFMVGDYRGLDRTISRICHVTDSCFMFPSMMSGV